MRVITKSWFDVRASDVFRIYPLGCLHVGAAGCDEKNLAEMVAEIAQDDRAFWLGLGDMGNYIARNDKRFNPLELASWIKVSDLVDLPKAQVRRIRQLLAPIAHKCIALVEGNHERKIKECYERDVYMEIVDGIKQDGGIPPDQPIACGYYGYLDLHFYKGPDTKGGSRVVTFSLHHGSGGTEAAVQRWLYSHEADVALFAHIHRTRIVNVAVEYADKAGRIRTKKRRAAHCGTFLTHRVEGCDDYAAVKGLPPVSHGGVMVELRPLTEPNERSIRITEF